MRARKRSAASAPGVRLQTVTGALDAGSIGKVLAHEHMFVDFSGPDDAGYMDAAWSNKIGAAVESAAVLRAQGVDLVVDWTNLGVGRNALALRDVSRQSGVRFVCPTGIYKALVPPALAALTSRKLADHFIGELAAGIDGTGIRAGFVKAAASESGATAAELPVLRAAVIAATETGATIGFHGPQAATTRQMAALVETQCGTLERFVWAHAQVASLDDNKRFAARGARLQYDAIGARSDPFFDGPVDDEAMLARLEAMVAAGYGDRILLSTDASVCVNPPAAQYDRSNAYLYRYFEAMLEQRLGAEPARRILRDNVLEAFRLPERL